MSQMLLKKLQQSTQNNTVTECKHILRNKKLTLIFKRLFDLILAVIMTLILSLPMIICCIAVAIGNDGPIFFLQERVGKDGKIFKIIKFRTMTANNNGSEITVNNDNRITKAGAFLRNFRLDELPQLFNVIAGDMSFVGPRPEVAHFVEFYTEDWLATLLIKPGITCESSIYFADEAEILDQSDNAEACYINTILPKKCELNIDYIKNISILNDIKIMLKTVKRVLS